MNGKDQREISKLYLESSEMYRDPYDYTPKVSDREEYKLNELINDIRADERQFDMQNLLPHIATVNGGRLQNFIRKTFQRTILNRNPKTCAGEETHEGEDHRQAAGVDYIIEQGISHTL